MSLSHLEDEVANIACRLRNMEDDLHDRAKASAGYAQPHINAQLWDAIRALQDIVIRQQSLLEQLSDTTGENIAAIESLQGLQGR